MLSVDWAPGFAFAFILIFARVGTMLMVMPALGEATITARARLSFALITAAVLMPVVRPLLPEAPNSPMAALMPLMAEILIGLLLGGISRLAVSSVQVAGASIASAAGLSMAQTADPVNGAAQGALIGSFLSYVGIAAIFAFDLHHLALYAIRDSYMLFRPGAPLLSGDAADVAIKGVAGAFRVGVEMSGPFIVFSLVFNIGMGLLAKMMPQLQVFFLAMPAAVALGLGLLGVTLVGMMGLYLNHFSDVLRLIRGLG